MFASIGRRLALLNAGVVVAVIALVGISTFSLLRQSLDREADQALADRAAVARASWSDLFTSGQPLPTSVQPEATADQETDEPAPDGQGDDHGVDNEADELLESGDILLFAVDASGSLL